MRYTNSSALNRVNDAASVWARARTDAVEIASNAGSRGPSLLREFDRLKGELADWVSRAVEITNAERRAAGFSETPALSPNATYAEVDAWLVERGKALIARGDDSRRKDYARPGLLGRIDEQIAGAIRRETGADVEIATGAGARFGAEFSVLGQVSDVERASDWLVKHGWPLVHEDREQDPEDPGVIVAFFGPRRDDFAERDEHQRQDYAEHTAEFKR